MNIYSAIFIYRLRLLVRSGLWKAGFRRRYLFLGARLDQRVCQKLFDELPVLAKKHLTKKAPRDVEKEIPVFLHIPKTGGVSVGRIFDKNLFKENWYNTNTRPEDGYYSDYFRCGVTILIWE